MNLFSYLIIGFTCSMLCFLIYFAIKYTKNMFKLSSNNIASNIRIDITKDELASIVKAAVRDAVIHISTNNDSYNQYSNIVLNINDPIFYGNNHVEEKSNSNYLNKNLQLTKGSSNLKAA